MIGISLKFSLLTLLKYKPKPAAFVTFGCHRVRIWTTPRHTKYVKSCPASL